MYSVIFFKALFLILVTESEQIFNILLASLLVSCFSNNKKITVLSIQDSDLIASNKEVLLIEFIKSVS